MSLMKQDMPKHLPTIPFYFPFPYFFFSFSALKLIPLPSDQKSLMKPNTIYSIHIDSYSQNLKPYHHHLNLQPPPSLFSPYLPLIFKPSPCLFYTFIFPVILSLPHLLKCTKTKKSLV